MSSFRRTKELLQRTAGSEPGLLRDVALVCAADGVVGLSFGAIAVASGTPLWVPVLLSLVVFAGASQFVFVALVTGGASPLAAALTGAVLNARLVPLGMAVADVMPARGWRRLLGAHLLTDESAAFTLPRRDPGQRRAAFWLTGGALFVCWNLGVALGALVGGAVTDPNLLGFDAAFPAVLLALLVPALRTRADRRTALAGAVVAVVAVPLLPAGLPAVAATLGVLAGRSSPPRDDQGIEPDQGTEPHQGGAS